MKQICTVVLIGLFARTAMTQSLSVVPGQIKCPEPASARCTSQQSEATLGVTFLHRVKKGRLDIELLNGSIHSFVDNDADNDRRVLHTAVAVAAHARYVVVSMAYYESYGFGILDRKSGKVTKLYGHPLFSPDERWLAVASGNENDEAYLQILEVADGAFRPAFDAKPVKWWPSRIEWQGSSSLVYGHSSFRSAVDVVTVSRDVRFDGVSWQ
jgi:hypothetical protein